MVGGPVHTRLTGPPILRHRVRNLAYGQTTDARGHVGRGRWCQPQRPRESTGPNPECAGPVDGGGVESGDDSDSSAAVGRIVDRDTQSTGDDPADDAVQRRSGPLHGG